ncbi:hypothetical protein SAMN04515695_4239 [Pseudovibrio sp. Tun.PSC04-5.I4]|nr:hypothetical protein SAMN04515695_4239 [Pseudovibrio sp. Tun.PSC04-5.I4]
MHALRASLMGGISVAMLAAGINAASANGEICVFFV